MITGAGNELDEAIRQTFPARDEEGRTDRPLTVEEALPDGFEEGCAEVAAEESGYVQEIDTDGLLALAVEHELVIELRHGRGSFVVTDRPLARVRGELDDETKAAIADTLILGSGRSSSRDVERGVEQLAEVAVRALSPGINDPFTAGQALRRLGQSLTLMADRKLPTPVFHDDEGNRRLLVPTPTVSELLHLAFDQPRHYGRSDPPRARRDPGDPDIGRRQGPPAGFATEAAPSCGSRQADGREGAGGGVGRWSGSTSSRPRKRC